VSRRKGAARRSFQQLDRDGDGLITVADLAAVLREGDPGLRRGAGGRARSLDLAASIVSEVDGGRRGALTFEDFSRVWSSGAAIAPAPRRSADGCALPGVTGGFGGAAREAAGGRWMDGGGDAGASGSARPAAPALGAATGRAAAA
jgi:hypothetical protein